MKFVVDEMPYWSDDCPFHYDGGCTLQHCNTATFVTILIRGIKTQQSGANALA